MILKFWLYAKVLGRKKTIVATFGAPAGGGAFAGAFAISADDPVQPDIENRTMTSAAIRRAIGIACASRVTARSQRLSALRRGFRPLPLSRLETPCRPACGRRA